MRSYIDLQRSVSDIYHPTPPDRVNTVKLVYKNSPCDQQRYGPFIQVVFLCRFNNMESISLGTCEMWSL